MQKFCNPLMLRALAVLSVACAAYGRARYAIPGRPVYVLMPDNDARVAMLAKEVRVDMVTATNLEMALAERTLAIVDATAEHLRQLAASARLKAFTERGGILMLWGLKPDGMDDFNRIAGTRHLIRKAARDPLAHGPTGPLPPIVNAFFYPRGVESASPFMAAPQHRVLQSQGAGTSASDAIFAFLVSTDNIAPFCTLTNPDGSPMTGSAAQMIDNRDHTPSTHTLKRGHFSFRLVLPRLETVRAFRIVQRNSFSQPISELTLTFSDCTVERFTPGEGNRPSLYSFRPRQASNVLVTVATPAASTTIAEIGLLIEEDAAQRARVQPCLNVGGFIFYPHGKGGIILNQIMPLPKNAQASGSYLAHVLQNLGCAVGQPVRVFPDAGERAPDGTPMVRVLLRGDSFSLPACSLGMALLYSQGISNIALAAAGHGDVDKQYGKNGMDTCLRAAFDYVLVSPGVGRKLECLEYILAGKPVPKPEDSAVLRDFFRMMEDVRASGARPIFLELWMTEADFFFTWLQRGATPPPNTCTVMRDPATGRCKHCQNVAGLKQPRVLYEAVRASTRRSSDLLSMPVVPMRDAFRRSLEQHPEIDLYAHKTDRHHGSPRGIYLAACVFYTCFSGRSPLGLDPEKMTTADFTSACARARPDRALARTLQHTAWDAWREERKEFPRVLCFTNHAHTAHR